MHALVKTKLFYRWYEFKKPYSPPTITEFTVLKQKLHFNPKTGIPRTTITFKMFLKGLLPFILLLLAFILIAVVGAFVSYKVLHKSGPEGNIEGTFTTSLFICTALTIVGMLITIYSYIVYKFEEVMYYNLLKEIIIKTESYTEFCKMFEYYNKPRFF